MASLNLLLGFKWPEINLTATHKDAFANLIK